MLPKYKLLIVGLVASVLVGCANSPDSAPPSVPAGFSSDPNVFRGAYETTAISTLGDELYEDEVALTPDDRFVIATLENDVRVWNTQSREQRYRLSPRSQTCQKCWPSVLDVSPDSTTLASLGVGNNSEVALFDLRSGKRMATWPLPDTEAEER